METSAQMKTRYNSLLSKFKFLELQIENSINPQESLKTKEKEWKSLADELSKILNKIGPYTQQEACNGFGVSNERKTTS